MNFVLLGEHSEFVPLVRAIERSPHEVIAAVCDDATWNAVAPFAAGARRMSHWEQLLVEPGLHVAMIGGHASQTLDGARRLAAAGVSLLVFPDLRQGSAFAYELWPYEDEGAIVLLPAFAHRADERWREIARQTQSGRGGAVRHAELERFHPASAAGVLSSGETDGLLLSDADLLRWVVGDFSRVTCVPLGSGPQGAARTNITFAGDGRPESTWSLRGGPAAGRLTLTTDRETIVHEWGPGVREPGDPERGGNSAEALLSDLERRVAGETAACAAQWLDLVRAFDVVEAARRSARRRRTIELGSEEVSERRQFKSHMTALGCGVLVYTLLGVIAALLAGAICDPRDAAQMRASAAGFIIGSDEFVEGTDELTPAGRAHVASIPSRLWQTTAEILVEADSDERDAAGELDARRRTTVVDALRADNAADIDTRTVVRPLPGKWFRRMMFAVWGVVFLPLATMLALQLLIVIARPGRREQRG